MTSFAITQQFLDESLKSSNSTEILMRLFYVQNFITIGLSFEDLSCKRPDGRIDTLINSIVYSLSEYTKTLFSRNCLLIMKNFHLQVSRNCSQIRISRLWKSSIKLYLSVQSLIKGFQGRGIRIYQLFIKIFERKKSSQLSIND